jgi:hypothetical protein
VSSDGVVTGVSAGTATITVKTQDGNKTADCNVTVSATAINVTGVFLDKTSANVAVNGTVTLTPTIMPANATNQKVTWSSNSDAATVSDNGVVTGVRYPGSARITVTTEDGGFTASCIVTIDPIFVVTNTSQWNSALTFIKNGGGSAGDPKAYTIQISGSVTVPASTRGTNTTFGFNANHIEVTLKGSGCLNIDPGTQGSLITISANQKVIIDDENLTLQGHQNNTEAVVGLETGGILELKNGTISGNYSSENSNNSRGGGVSVANFSSFTMSGGSISGNTGKNIGGVYVIGTFTKSGGGVIYGNNSSDSLSNTSLSGRGHAVYWSNYVGNDVFRDLYRDSTLNAGDNITTDTPTTPPWSN